MTEAQTIAWILYAVHLASGERPADFRAISEMADGINHAVPTHREMQSSLSWLSGAGLVVKVPGGYSLTAEGALVIDRARSPTTAKTWDRITQHIQSRLAA